MRDAELLVERPLGIEELTALATESERRTAEGFGSERRRREYLMWRYMVRRRLGADVLIGYGPTGCPQLENRKDYYIGVSHSDDLVAVVLSPRRCAVDVERLARDFPKVARRYVSPAEEGLSDDPRLAAVLWCAKETLYKYSDAAGLDLLRDIRISRVDFAAGTVAGSVRGGSEVEMRMSERDGNMIVWVG